MRYDEKYIQTANPVKDISYRYRFRYLLFGCFHVLEWLLKTALAFTLECMTITLGISKVV